MEKWLAENPASGESKASLVDKLPVKLLASKRKLRTSQHAAAVTVKTAEAAHKKVRQTVLNAFAEASSSSPSSSQTAPPPPLVPLTPEEMGKQIAAQAL